MKTESSAVSRASEPQSVDRDTKPNCYQCKYRGAADFSAHSSCKHPKIGAEGILTPMFMMQGTRSPLEKRMNISYNRHGFNNGWFSWPINFDPVWLESCDGFEQKDSSPN